MARNSLMPQLQLYDAPAAPNVAGFTNPLMQGLQTYRQGMQQQFEGERALETERQNQERLKLAKNADGRAGEAQRMAKERAEVERMGKLAQVIHDDPNDATAAPRWQSLVSSNPQMPALLQKYGVDPKDHRTGAKFLMAEVGTYKDPRAREIEALKLDQARAQTDVTKAQADYYRSRAGALSDKRSNGTAAADSDPLQGAGLDEDGNLITQKAQQPAQSYGYGDGSISFGLPGYQQQGGLPEPMRLGGPRDDIDASMRVDEGRVPRGTQVAQAGGPPTAMEQARVRMYGPSGVMSPDVPGVVTDAGRNRRVDPLATREMQGQRAMDAATPDQQERLRAFRQDQELWSGVYKRQPRAGYYYGPDGRELALTDKNFKGDKEAQAQALINMQKITQASNRLLEDSYIGRTAAGLANIGETGQAFADTKQAALGIAYALSGKTVAIAEMKNFVDAYGPTPGDTDARIKAKTERMLQFYHALLSASRGGQDYDKAFASAMARMGVKNPDGTLAGAPQGPLSATDGDRATKRAPDLSGVSTEELLRRLGGGR